MTHAVPKDAIYEHALAASSLDKSRRLLDDNAKTSATTASLRPVEEQLTKGFSGQESGHDDKTLYTSVSGIDLPAAAQQASQVAFSDEEARLDAAKDLAQDPIHPSDMANGSNDMKDQICVFMPGEAAIDQESLLVQA